MEVYEVQRFLQEYRMFRMAVVLITMMCHTLAIRIFRITEHSIQGLSMSQFIQLHEAS